MLIDPKEIRNASIERLKVAVNGYMECPMCHGKKFAVVDGFFTNWIQRDLNGFSIGGKGVPMVAIICDRCGFVSHHAIEFIGKEDREKGVSDGSN